MHGEEPGASPGRAQPQPRAAGCWPPPCLPPEMFWERSRGEGGQVPAAGAFHGPTAPGRAGAPEGPHSSSAGGAARGWGAGWRGAAPDVAEEPHGEG